jgi:hypothetical protein
METETVNLRILEEVIESLVQRELISGPQDILTLDETLMKAMGMASKLTMNENGVFVVNLIHSDGAVQKIGFDCDPSIAVRDAWDYFLFDEEDHLASHIANRYFWFLAKNPEILIPDNSVTHPLLGWRSFFREKWDLDLRHRTTKLKSGSWFAEFYCEGIVLAVGTDEAFERAALKKAIQRLRAVIRACLGQIYL